MSELEEALAARMAKEEQNRLRREMQESEAEQLGAELAKDFIAAAKRLGIKPDKVLEHVTFYYHEHPNASRLHPDRSRGKDIGRVEVARCWDIYGYLLTAEGCQAVPTHQRSETRKRLFGKPYSIGEDGWELRNVLASERLYTTTDSTLPLKDAMAQYLDWHSRK